MKIKIISDGTCYGTRVVDAETGEPIDGVTNIKWRITVGGLAVAKITVIGEPAELVGTILEPPPQGGPHGRLC